MSDSKPSAKAASPKKRIGGRLYSQETIFKAAWSQIAQALWKRYPNPCSTHVLSEDTVSRKQESPTKLSSKRIILKTNRAPRWMEMFVGGDRRAAVIEESFVDLDQRTFTTYTRNITFSTLMAVEEKCVYYESLENKCWTCCKKEVWVKCGLRSVGRAVEKFGVERYKKNSRKAEQGLEYVIGKLFSIPVIVTVPSKSIPLSSPTSHV